MMARTPAGLPGPFWRSARLAAAAGPSPDRDLAIHRLQSLRDFYGLLDGAVETVLTMEPEQIQQMLQTVKMLGRSANS